MSGGSGMAVEMCWSHAERYGRRAAGVALPGEHVVLLLMETSRIVVNDDRGLLVDGVLVVVVERRCGALQWRAESLTRLCVRVIRRRRGRFGVRGRVGRVV